MRNIYIILICFIWFTGTLIAMYTPITPLVVIALENSCVDYNFLVNTCFILLFIVSLGFVSFYTLVKPEGINFIGSVFFLHPVRNPSKTNKKVSYIVSITCIITNMLISLAICDTLSNLEYIEYCIGDRVEFLSLPRENLFK